MFERRAIKKVDAEGDTYYILQKKIVFWKTVGVTYYRTKLDLFLNPPSNQPPEYLYPRTEITNE